MAAGAVTVNISKPSGKGMYFDGVNDVIELPAISAVTIFSIDAWIKITGNVNFNRIIYASEKNAAGVGIDLRIGATNKLELYCGGSKIESPLTYGIANGWIHIVGTYDGREAKLYVDGSEINKKTISQPNAAKFNSPLIGAYDVPVSNMFKGNIDEMKMYSRVLSETEVLNLYAKKNTATGILANWSFNDSSDPAHDDSGNGNDGTVTGAISAGGHNTTEDDITAARVGAADRWGFIPLASDKEIMTVHIEE